MISFIQQILQKHHKWIFGTLLGVVIVAFVFTVGATPGIVGKKRRVIFYGKNLLSWKEMKPIVNAAWISSKTTEFSIQSKEQLDQLVLIRCALLSQADMLQIPPVDDRGLSEFIKTLPGFFGEKNAFSKEKYDAFLAACERNGFSKSEVRTALLDDQRIGVLKRAVAGNGIIFDYQLKKTLSMFYSEYDLAVAELSYNSFTPKISASEFDLQKFYEKHSNKYRIPEMVATSIVRFEATQPKKDAQPPPESILREYFQTEREKFSAYPDFESAKDEVVSQYLKLESQRLAGQNADEFVSELYGNDIGLNSKEWQDLLSKFGVTKEKVAAYSRLKLPEVNGVPEAALLSVCNMDSSRYYSDPFVTDFGAAVLIVEGRKEAYILPFSEAKQYVEQDVREEKRKNKFKTLVEEIEKFFRETTQANAPTDFEKYELMPQFFDGISLIKDAEKVDSKIFRALSLMKENERVRSIAVDDGVAFIVVLDCRTPSYADMKEKDGGEIEKRLFMFDRDFCFAEYANWLVERRLSKIK
ncbi:MAG: SurA N-terminal domain-containing protein [Puniceicoccales bacterium]|nr:SurA N-terminal domain-containing protein [Puniceicoccales bacterium]